MKRKLAPLVPCPELHHINKTMIIKVPLELRESGHPIFRIVTSLDDLENPRVKFKANDLLKIILGKDTAEKNSDAICTREKKAISLKSSEDSHEKPFKLLSNSTVTNKDSEAKTAYQKLSKRDTDIDHTVVSLEDSDPKQMDCFSHASVSFSGEPSYSCLEAHKQQKTSLSVKEGNPPVLKNCQNAGGEYKLFHQLSKPADFMPREQEILQQKAAKTFGKYSKWENFKDYENFGSSQAVNGNINHGPCREIFDDDCWSACTNHGSDSSHGTPENNFVTAPKGEGFAFGTPQTKGFVSPQEIDRCKDFHSFPHKGCHKPKSVWQKNPVLGMCDKRNCNSDHFQLPEDLDSALSSGQKSVRHADPFFQYSELSDFHENSRNNHKSCASLSLRHDSDLKTDEQKVSFGDGSGAGSENLFSNKFSSWSTYRGLNKEWSEPTQSSPGCSANKVLYQEEQKQRAPMQASWSNNKKPHQVPSKSMYKSADEFPKHCFWKDLKWDDLKQIIFLDVQSYPNFFREFEKIPPPGMHIWIFMPPTYKLKYPYELINLRLLNMKLLHIILGDVNAKFPDTVYDLHCKLPSSTQFIIVSNRQFSKVKSIENSRTMNLVCPKFSEGIAEIYRYIFRIDP